MKYLYKRIKKTSDIICEAEQMIDVMSELNIELYEEKRNLERIFNICVFDLMNKMSYRKFMKYMRKNYGW